MKIIEQYWNELETEDSTVIVGIALIEQHGRHMPLGVDYYLTQRWIEGVSDRLNNEDKKLYTLPVIPIGCSDIGGLPGCTYVSQKSIYCLVKDLLISISKWGIKNIVVISAHADPKHLIAIEQACKHVNKKYGVIAFSPMGAFFSGNELGIEQDFNDEVKQMLCEYPNDFHAGWIETSLMLYYSNMVKDDYKKAEDIILQDKDMIFPQKVSRKIAGVGHIGYPRFADKALGENIHNCAVDLLFDLCMKFIQRKDYEKYQHHFLYKIPFLRPKPFRR